MTEISEYRNLIGRLPAEQIARSENDLSSRLSRTLEEVGLYTVVDTAGGSERRKRPDIMGYLDEGNADLAGSAEVVIESKKPLEVPGDLLLALLNTELWTEKFLPYCTAHLSSVQYFVLTTFDRFLVIEITDDVRRLLISRESKADRYRGLLTSNSHVFDIRSAGEKWEDWWRTNFAPASIRPVPLSDVLDVYEVASRTELGQFADALATSVAGQISTPESSSALIHSVRINATNVSDLPPTVLASLTVYVMAQHRSLDAAAARAYISENLDKELAAFVSASINSLVARLFAYKVIEDCFCRGQPHPLINPQLYIFHSTRYDTLDAPGLLSTAMASMRGLQDNTTPAIESLAKTGSFFDWIEGQVDARAFRRLFLLMATHDFSKLEGDLLGRFFEHYAQRVDKRKRKAFGQYYTPMEIVNFMWAHSLEIAGARAQSKDFAVLDPGVGSATFLVEGARRTAKAGLDAFWERLVGFDIDPQVIGVAYVNLFLAVLSQLTPTEAEKFDGLKLYPTDTLDPSSSARLEAILPLLTAAPLIEFLESQISMSKQAKRSESYDIVIGNPPYHNNSDRTLQQVCESFPRLLTTSRRNARAKERNIRDDYAWFFAASDNYIRKDGMIAFIVSDSFCKLDSYRYFRMDLLRYYNISRLVNLGEGIFEDVGPRISFVIIFLERRPDGTHDIDSQVVSYCDLRGLAAAERLALLASVGEGVDSLSYETYVPSVEHGYALTPIAEVVTCVKASGPPLVGGSNEGVFKRKWPGLITAFDILFLAETPKALEERWASFFRCVDAVRERDVLVAKFAVEIGASPEDIVRLNAIISSSRSQKLHFSREKIRRVITGSTPNEDRWYPSRRLTRYVYYETRLNVERNQNEGKSKGWGTMNQWGISLGQDARPKLIFTTGAKPRYGLKAFVVKDDWYVKLHGGTSQQFSYALVDNPTMTARLDGLPNNLSSLTEDFFRLFRLGVDDDAEDFLLYIAGLYNSEVAELFLSGGGGKMLHIPLGNAEIARNISAVSRRLRDLKYLEEALGDNTELNLDGLSYEVSYLLEGLGLETTTRGGGRMKAERIVSSDGGTSDRIRDAMDAAQTTLEGHVKSAYGII